MRSAIEAKGATRNTPAARSTSSWPTEYPDDPKLDEFYYNAAVDFERAKLLGSAIQAREQLLEGQAGLAAGEEGDLPHRPQLSGRRRVRQGGRQVRGVRHEVPGETPSRREDAKALDAPSLCTAFFRRGLGENDKAIKDVDALHQELRRTARVHRQGGRRRLRPGPDLRAAAGQRQAEEALPGLPEEVGRQGRRRSAGRRARQDRRDRCGSESCPLPDGGINGACIEHQARARRRGDAPRSSQGAEGQEEEQEEGPLNLRRSAARRRSRRSSSTIASRGWSRRR